MTSLDGGLSHSLELDMDHLEGQIMAARRRPAVLTDPKVTLHQVTWVMALPDPYPRHLWHLASSRPAGLTKVAHGRRR